jgi:hypothetical protein
MNGLSIVILTSLLLFAKYLYVTFRSDNVVYVRIPRDKVMMIFLCILALTNTMTWILATI